MKLNPWPYAIALYFAIFIGAIAVWITFAVRHDDQLVRSDYYEQELKYQTDIDGQSRGARADVNVSYDSTRQLVTIALPAPVASGSIYFYRPSDPQADRELPLALKDGAQRAAARNFEHGLWKVRVTWIKDISEHRHNATLVFAPTEISLR